MDRSKDLPYLFAHLNVGDFQEQTRTSLCLKIALGLLAWTSRKGSSLLEETQVILAQRFTQTFLLIMLLFVAAWFCRMEFSCKEEDLVTGPLRRSNDLTTKFNQNNFQGSKQPFNLRHLQKCLFPERSLDSHLDKIYTQDDCNGRSFEAWQRMVCRIPIEFATQRTFVIGFA